MPKSKLGDLRRLTREIILKSASPNLRLVKTPTLEDRVERRVERRRSIYLGEGLRIRVEVNGETLDGECVSLSTGGMAIALPVTKDSKSLATKEKIKIGFEIPGYHWTEFNAVISHVTPVRLSNRLVVRIGVKYETDNRGGKLETTTRKSARIRCADYFPPVAYAEHPLFFSEFLHFKVLEFSRYGFELETSARNKGLIIGMQLHLKVLIPIQGEFDVQATIRNVRTMNNDKVSVGLGFDKFPHGFLPAVSEYLVSFSGVSPKFIKESGFIVEKMEKALAFGYVTSEEDWEQVLHLRYTAYKAAGKFTQAKDPKDMKDEFDNHARQIICKVNGKVVAAARIVFLDGDMARSEHTAVGVNVPKFLHQNTVEVSRACTHLDYRGSDLLIKLLSHIARVTYQSGNRYVLMNCNDNMWPYYKKTGARKTGIRFDLPGVTGCNLVFMDMHDIVGGRRGNLLVWHYGAFPLMQFLKKTHSFPKRLFPFHILHRAIRPLVRLTFFLLFYRKRKTR